MAEATKITKAPSDPYFCRFHIATVGSDTKINADTVWSKPFRYKAFADEITVGGYDDWKLKTVTVIILE